MSALSTFPPRFNPLDPAVLEDPYPRYAELRRAGRLARGGPGTWLVTRYKDVAELLGDRRLGNEFPSAYHELSRGSGPASAFFQRIIFYRDPPAHTRLRRLMAAAFTPRLVGTFQERIRSVVGELLAPGLERGSFDVVGELAYPLALRTICMLLGIPPADEGEVLPRAADLANGFTFGGSDEQRAATDDAALWLQRYLEDLLGERRLDPDGDLLSRMLASRTVPGGLSHEEIVDNCVFLFWAGFETVVSVIGTACAALARFPDQFKRLRAEPGLRASAVDEFLRYDAPIQGTSRIVHEEVQIGRHRLRPGRIIVLLLGSANHDERVFADPTRVDIGRRPNPHVSFGGGPHRCLGSVLARAETTIVLEELAHRVHTLELAGACSRRTSMTWMRFHSRIPVAASRALVSPSRVA